MTWERCRHRATFQNGQRHHLFFEVPPPALWLMVTVAKNLEVSTLKEQEKECIRELMSNWQTSFRFIFMYFFLSSQSTLPLVWILSYNFFFYGVRFATLSKPSSFTRESCTLCFGEELWRLIFPSFPPASVSFAEQRGKESSFKKCWFLLVMAGQGM